MTAPPQQPWPYGPYTPPAPWAPPPRLRGRRPLIIGIVVLAIGVALAVSGGVLAAVGSLGQVEHFSRVSVAQGTGTAHFGHPGGYVAYYESSTVSNSTRQIPLIQGVLLNEQTGQRVVLDTTYGNRSDHKINALHYSYRGHNGVAMWQFHIDTAGTWQVRLLANPDAAPDAVVAFGPSVATGIVGSAVLLVAGILAFIAGAVLLTVGLGMRAAHKRELRRRAAYGPPGFHPPPYGTGPPG